MKRQKDLNLLILPSQGISFSSLPGEEFKWAYFGEDFLRFQNIQAHMPKNGNMIDFGGQLKKNTTRLRKQYIDYIGNLSKENKSLYWWAGALSEKNPFISKTFLYSCYLRTCLDILEEKGSEGRDIVFFIEKKCLREDLEANIKSNYDINVTRKEPPRSWIRDIYRDTRTFLTKKIHFTISNSYRIILSTYLYKNKKEISKNNERENIFLFTWITRPPFGENNKYHDGFYGDLIQIAKERYLNKRISIVPYTLGTISYKENLRAIKNSDESFIEPWSLLKIRDVLNCLLISIKNHPKRISFPRFSGMDINNIIYQDQKSQWLDKRFPTDLLFYKLVERWKNKGFKIDRFIYLFENHTWEKMFISSFRKYYPETSLIGYQHSTIPETMLNHFFSEDELKIIPLPDKIITNGKHPTALLEKYGYPKSILKPGGAIRFSQLLELEMRQGNGKNNGGPQLLVTPPIGMLESIELIKKIYDALINETNLSVIIKCHPAMPFNYFAHLLDFELPQHFSISDSPLDDLLKEADILFYTSSTTSIEAMAVGVDVVHINTDYSLEMDPLDFATDVRYDAGSPEEIIKVVNDILEMPEDTRKDRKNKGAETVKKLFAPVTDETYELFLGK